MTSRLLCIVTAILLWPSLRLRAEDQWSSPFSGVSYLHRTGASQLSAHAVIVDLCAPGVGVRHTAFSERGRTASSFAQLTGAQVVINGDWSCRPVDVGVNSAFAECRGLPSYHTYGVAAHAGQPWPSNWSHDGLLAFAAGRVEMYDYNEHKTYHPWMQEAMSGHFQLVRDGMVAFEAATGVATDRPPRSAIGLSEDRTQLILVTVDGRRSYIGMNEAELAAFLVEMGAYSAFGLDGGGSSTLWLQNQGVVNDPSDGVERVVGPHLGIFASGSGPAMYCDRPWETHPSSPLPALELLGEPGGFYPRTPVRVYDTRNATGSQHLDGLQRAPDQRPIGQGVFSYANFSAHAVPSDASAVAMNLTVANQDAWGFVTAWPGYLSQPDTSNLNHGPTQAVANSALIHLNVAQQMKLYSYASAHHLGDLTGWFAPEGAGFVARTPLRILDTRSGPAIPSEGSRQIMPAPTDGASAVALGVVALSAESDGFITVYPCHVTRPDTSTINFGAHDIVSGSILVPTGPQGVCAYSYGEAHLLVDHFGSFIDGRGAELQAVRPTRLIDTRSPNGRWVGRVPHESVQELNLSTIPGFPSDAEAIAVNLTAVDPASDGFASLGPCNNRGNASSINYKEAQTSSTTSVVKVNSGAVCLYVYGRTHILIDLVGFFIPPPNPCLEQPCLNGATCVSDRTEYSCECLVGYSGVHCEVNVDDCVDHPCQNNGVCLDEVNGYSCDCPDEFSGARCEVNVDDCVGVTCEHGGLCVDLIGDYRCDCLEGYTGERCEELIVEPPADMEPPPEDMSELPAPSPDSGPLVEPDSGSGERDIGVAPSVEPVGGEQGGDAGPAVGGASMSAVDPPAPSAGVTPEVGGQGEPPPATGQEADSTTRVQEGCAQGRSASPLSLWSLIIVALWLRRRAQSLSRGELEC